MKGGVYLEKGYKGEGLLNEKERGEGILGKMPFFFLPPVGNRGGAPGRRRWLLPAALGMTAAETRGKRRGVHGESIPPINLGGSGLWRRCHGGGWRPALVFVAASRLW